MVNYAKVTEISQINTFPFFIYAKVGKITVKSLAAIQFSDLPLTVLTVLKFQFFSDYVVMALIFSTLMAIEPDRVQCL